MRARKLAFDFGQVRSKSNTKKQKDNLSKAIKITKNKNNFSSEYLFDVFSNYELYRTEKGFKF